MEYFILFVAVLCIFIQFNVNKVYQKKFVSGMSDILFYPFLCGVIGVMFFTILGYFLYGSLPDFTMFSFSISILQAVISTFSFIIGILIMKYGKMSEYSMFMMLGGMILPYFFGIIALDETVSATQIIGLCILIFALPFSTIKPKNNIEQTKQPKLYYILCILIFFINGSTSIVSKVHSINVEAIPAANFVVYVNLWQAVINGVIYVIFTAINKKIDKPTDKTAVQKAFSHKTKSVITIAIYAIVSGFGFLFQLIAAETVPAVVIYPFVTGGTIVLSTIGARIFFKEKVSVPMFISIILSFAGTILFVIK